jgi:hypothetical protein
LAGFDVAIIGRFWVATEVLTEMNVRLSSAVTDLSGATGLAIIQAIVDG